MEFPPGWEQRYDASTEKVGFFGRIFFLIVYCLSLSVRLWRRYSLLITRRELRRLSIRDFRLKRKAAEAELPRVVCRSRRLAAAAAAVCRVRLRRDA